MKKIFCCYMICFICVYCFAHKQVNFTFYGTKLIVKIDNSIIPKLNSIDENNISLAWEYMSKGNYKATLDDCERLRNQIQLNDWGYLLLINKLALACTHTQNDATLLTAFLFANSGYNMRLAKNDNNDLLLLYASEHVIYGMMRYTIQNTYYYTLKLNQVFENEENIEVLMPYNNGGKTLSLKIDVSPKLAKDMSKARPLKAKRYPEWDFSISINKNLIDFYNDYPSSYVNDDFMTRWSMLAETPFSEETKKQLYPVMARLISGLSQKESVERILNWVQTAFPYAYDDEVWGHDRAFFPEETLYYAGSDTEDRSALLIRLISDLMGLKTLLLYYPGHTAIAVRFTGEAVDGDELYYEGQKYIICDGLYIGARVGMSMPQFANQAPDKVISINILENDVKNEYANNSIKSQQETARLVATKSQKDFYNPIINNGQSRIALIIGNGDYSTGYLSNPTNDATDIAKKLKLLGFETIVRINQTFRNMKTEISSFCQKAQQYDAALLYYAGHAIQNNGINYLVPIGTSITSNSDIEYECIDLNWILKKLEDAQVNTKIIVLDACRDNPIARSWERGINSNALAETSVPEGTFLVFSTQPGKVAKDGNTDQRNSPYTEAFLQVLDRPMLPIHDVFREVRKIVAQKTSNEQIPTQTDNLLGDFYFNMNRE